MRSRAARALSPELLAERALAIIDADGLEALTMRRLAADVGVKAPSLYNHVANKDELIDGALRVMRAEFRLPSPAPEHWKPLLVAIFIEYRRVLAAHPNMIPLAGRRLPGESQSGLVYLTSQGFTTEESVEIWQSLLALTVGFSMFSSGQADTDTRELPAPLHERAAHWRDETFVLALVNLLAPYDPGAGDSPVAFRGEPVQ
ncbi:TetR family transcriptional regulator [Nostocoides sp. F2B08]|uniref:TetR family transcriptional regulator n=1 Tax=Nostocoides sp. F2B08 TaxID=2653936 RepID=UPI0012630615|nr:TetR family transcriptional regulator [Tetrasphaera sp. F2B08]KAB7740595.1 TetR family transcriptional regulator [Tetrasphaera sp. F2B08]